MHLKFTHRLAIALRAVVTPLAAQSRKRPLTQDDWDRWRAIQGIELFVGMRRLGKEAYLINYNNELHSPQSRANLKDFSTRMMQFFDTKLKGAPAPDWIVKGIPAKDKGKDQIAPKIVP